MIFKILIYCCYEVEILLVIIKLDIIVVILLIILVLIKVGIIGIKILEMVFNIFLNGEVLFCFVFCCVFI